jgi:hypothetical protein
MNNLVWFTGAPGSKWSGTANILQAIQQLNFNISDRTPEREYTHTGPTPLARSITHTGVYFGPGHGVGEHWDRLSVLDSNSVVREINKEWADASYGNLLVKSHFLSHHLDFISETFPNNPIIMVTTLSDQSYYYGNNNPIMVLLSNYDYPYDYPIIIMVLLSLIIRLWSYYHYGPIMILISNYGPIIQYCPMILMIILLSLIIQLWDQSYYYGNNNPIIVL